MYGIQEMVKATEPNLKKIKAYMEETNMYHPQDASLYEGLSRSKARTVKESLRDIPLREFLDNTAGTTGDYLIAAKVYEELFYAAKQYDICPLIGRVASDWEGNSLKVDIGIDDSFKAYDFTSGGKMADSNVEVTQATLTPTSFGTSVTLTNNLIEDGAFPLIEWHITQAGKVIGQAASDKAITVLLAGTDGDGTINSSDTGDADETKWTGGNTSDIRKAIRCVGDDKFIPDTLLCTSEAYMHSISTGAAEIGHTLIPPTEGYNAKLGLLDVVISNSELLHASTDIAGATMTNCISTVHSRQNALLTGRKRWLRIENFSNPVEDLDGAVVSSRQDSVSLYNDSIYKLTED